MFVRRKDGIKHVLDHTRAARSLLAEVETLQDTVGSHADLSPVREAAQRLSWALRRSQVHGVMTNRQLLVGPALEAADGESARNGPLGLFIDELGRVGEAMFFQHADNDGAGARQLRFGKGDFHDRFPLEPKRDVL